MGSNQQTAKDLNAGQTGIVFDIKKYSIRDGPGIRTTVFFKGCPLNCRWCHNPESRRPGIEWLPGRSSPDQNSACSAEATVGCEVAVGAVMTEIMQDRVFYEQSGGGVTFSGGEPLFQPEFLFALLVECRREGIHTAVDTSGYAPLADLERVCGMADLLLYDLKLMNDEQHREYVGVSNELILANLRAIAGRVDLQINVRVPLIPDITDTEENLKAIAAFLESMRLRRISLLPYNKLGEDKRDRFGLHGHRMHANAQDSRELTKRAGLFEARGFEVAIGG